MSNNTDTVTSELYSEKPYISNDKPSFNTNNVVSKFYFSLPPNPPQFDKDGDMIVQRKVNTKNSHCLQLEHSNKTALDLVGLQIWRGALLLADYIIYNNEHFSNKKIMELGTGVGLTSIIAAMYSPVICTDINKGGILELIQSNVERNKNYVKHDVQMKELDFMRPLSKEIEEELPDVKIILAADASAILLKTPELLKSKQFKRLFEDGASVKRQNLKFLFVVIYDNDITEAFVNTLETLLKKTTDVEIYIALEKRFVFMVEDMMTNAPCFDYFIECLNVKGLKTEDIKLDFSQYFDYDRVKQLVLWKISCTNI